MPEPTNNATPSPASAATAAAAGAAAPAEPMLGQGGGQTGAADAGGAAAAAAAPSGPSVEEIIQRLSGAMGTQQQFRDDAVQPEGQQTQTPAPEAPKPLPKLSEKNRQALLMVLGDEAGAEVLSVIDALAGAVKPSTFDEKPIMRRLEALQSSHREVVLHNWFDREVGRGKLPGDTYGTSVYDASEEQMQERGETAKLAESIYTLLRGQKQRISESDAVHYAATLRAQVKGNTAPVTKSDAVQQVEKRVMDRSRARSVPSGSAAASSTGTAAEAARFWDENRKAL